MAPVAARYHAISLIHPLEGISALEHGTFHVAEEDGTEGTCE